MNKLTLLCICLCIFFIACKKSSDSSSSSPSIQGKWQLVNIISHVHTASRDTSATQNGLIGDYLDFRADGKVISSIQGGNDTTSYSLTNTKTLVIGNTDTLNIVTLTSVNLKLYQKYNSSQNEFYETTLNLKK